MEVRSRTITSSVCLFCEDIRHEQNGVDTLVGVLPDNINVPITPALLPKIGIYIRILFPLSKIPSKISSHLQTPWQKELVKLGEVSPKQIATAVDEARAQGSDGVRFYTKAIISPFQVPSPGTIATITSIDNRNLLAGILSFRVQQPST
jgi:hypothetical protein